MPKKKTKKMSEAARVMSTVKRITKILVSKEKKVSIQQCEKVLEIFGKYPSNFHGNKKRMFTFLACVMEKYFIQNSCYPSGNVSKKVATSLRDWRIVDFFKSKKFERIFPGINSSFEKPLTRENYLFLDAMKKVFGDFELRTGGKNRKILLHLLSKAGASTSQLAKIAGVSKRWVRKCKKL